MGQARQRKLQQQRLREVVLPAAERAGAALRKLASAASDSLGADCYLHALIGRDLMADQGVQTRIVVGYAAWRIGHADGDVISHVPHVQGFLPEGAEGLAFHAWLETVTDDGSAPLLIDFTTYQLERKAKELDEADGGHTNVDWHPSMLVFDRTDIRSYKEVAKAPGPGLAHYEEVPGLHARIAKDFKPDPEDLAAARTIMANPDAVVVGPNQFEDQPARTWRPVG